MKVFPKPVINWLWVDEEKAKDVYILRVLYIPRKQQKSKTTNTQTAVYKMMKAGILNSKELDSL